MYPGPDGPLASNRLILVADGIEDWQLFRRLGLDNASISNGDDLITQLIRNMTSRTGDPALLEHVRRQAARRVMAMAAKTDDDLTERRELEARSGVFERSLGAVC